MLDQIFSYSLNNFNFGYIISINVVAYFIIQFISWIIKKSLPKGIKIITTICVTIGLGILYHSFGTIENDVLINSSILAPVAWDWIIKPLFKLLKIDYKTEQL